MEKYRSTLNQFRRTRRPVSLPALFGSQPFAILKKCEYSVLIGLLQRNGALQPYGVASLRDDPLWAAGTANFVQKQAQRHARPFAA